MEVNPTTFDAKEMKVFASFNASVFVTHRIQVREYHGKRSSKMFSICAQGINSEKIYDEIIKFDKEHLIKLLPKDLILMNETRKTKTHLVSIIPVSKDLGDKEVFLSLDYPHYSCHDVAVRLQHFLCHGKVTIK